MRKLALILIVLTLFSCGSTDKVTQEVTLNPETAVKDIPSDVEIKEDTSIEEDITEPVIKEMVEDTPKTMDAAEVPLLVETVPNAVSTAKPFDHSIWNVLLQRHVNDNGDVDYKGFKKDVNILESYLSMFSDHMPTETWNRNEVLAYWINAYNAFTVKLIIVNYPTNSIKDIKDPWGMRFFKLGEKWYNLSEVEHKILRKMDEPRIHFAINCASFSCPKLLNTAFTATNLEAQLEAVTSNFINDPTRNKITGNSAELSQIFKWFKKDFTTQGNLITYLNKYADTKLASSAKIGYLKYDWSLNEAK